MCRHCSRAQELRGARVRRDAPGDARRVEVLGAAIDIGRQRRGPAIAHGLLPLQAREQPLGGRRLSLPEPGEAGPAATLGEGAALPIPIPHQEPQLPAIVRRPGGASRQGGEAVPVALNLGVVAGERRGERVRQVVPQGPMAAPGGADIPEAASLRGHPEAAGVSLGLRDEVDCAAHRVRAVAGRQRPPHHLDALGVDQVDQREVHRPPAGVQGVVEGDAIDHDQAEIRVAAADVDGAQASPGAGLIDVEPRHLAQGLGQDGQAKPLEVGGWEDRHRGQCGLDGMREGRAGDHDGLEARDLGGRRGTTPPERRATVGHKDVPSPLDSGGSHG